MKRRNFLAGLALAPFAAHAAPTEAERFAAAHADLFKRFVYYDARPMQRRPDLESMRVLRPKPATAAWDGLEGRIW
jgi:hypothetical protein